MLLLEHFHARRCTAKAVAVCVVVHGERSEAVNRINMVKWQRCGSRKWKMKYKKPNWYAAATLVFLVYSLCGCARAVCLCVCVGNMTQFETCQFFCLCFYVQNLFKQWQCIVAFMFYQRMAPTNLFSFLHAVCVSVRKSRLKSIDGENI